MKFSTKSYLVFFLALLGMSECAVAEKSDRSRPVQVDADSMRFDDLNKTGVYEGRVVLTQGTLTFKADRVDIRQDAQGLTSGKATGRQVMIRQKMDGKDEYMTGECDEAVYDARSGLIRMTGNARLQQGTDELRGPLIIYDLNTERYRAEGNASSGHKGRVSATINPKSAPDQSAGSARP